MTLQKYVPAYKHYNRENFTLQTVVVGASLGHVPLCQCPITIQDWRLWSPCLCGTDRWRVRSGLRKGQGT